MFLLSAKRFSPWLATLLALCFIPLVLAGSDSMQRTQALGEPLDSAALAQLPASIFPNGEGLPAGQGDGKLGADVFQRDCVACHGPIGRGGSAMELIGDRSLLNTEYPDKGIAVYWPYAPPLFDYIQRAMPPAAPYSLSADEVYAVIAYLLENSDVIEPGTVLDAAALAEISMPNVANFTVRLCHVLHAEK